MRAKIMCLHGFRQTSSNFALNTAAFRKRLKQTATFEFIDAPHPLADPPPELQHHGPLARSRLGWMVTPTQFSSDHLTVPDDADATQYQRQICGWEESLQVLEHAFNSADPPFDGILGFSQGAAVAAVLAALESKKPPEQRRFKFVICCSGYMSRHEEHQHILHPSSSLSSEYEAIDMPSLHLFCADDKLATAAKKDYQIAEQESRALASCFNPSSTRCIVHTRGHSIPFTPDITNAVKTFIEECMTPTAATTTSI